MRDRQFKGAIVLPPHGILGGRTRVRTPNGIAVELLGLIPIYKDEMDFKLNQGLDALVDRFDAHGVTAVLDPGRRAVMR